MNYRYRIYIKHNYVLKPLNEYCIDSFIVRNYVYYILCGAIGNCEIENENENENCEKCNLK